MKSPFPKTTYQRNAHIYRILANPTRLEMLNTMKHREVAVEALVKMLGLPKANVSQHLALLRAAKLVTSRRAGLKVFYKMTDPRIIEPCKILHGVWQQGRVSTAAL